MQGYAEIDPTGLAIGDTAAQVFYQYADVRDQQGHFREAADLLRGIVSGDPRNAVALNNLAWLVALHDGNAAEALRLLRQAVDAVGPVPEVRDTLAVVYLAQGQPDRAVQELQEVVEQQPTASGYFHLAQAYRKANNLPAAKAALAKATDLGLSADRLHALERGAFAQLRDELKK